MKTYRNGAILTVLVAMMVGTGTAFNACSANAMATGIDIMLENDIHGNKVTV